MFTEAPIGESGYQLLFVMAKAMDIALSVFVWLILARALMSWFNPSPHNPLVRNIYRLTEPILAPLRRLVPLRNTGLDLSPMLAILIVIILQSVVVSLLDHLLVILR